KAYRFYVESFPPAQGPAGSGLARAPRRAGVEGFMEQASSHLSSATGLTGLLLAPPLKHTTIARVDLVPLENDRALAVIVTDAGWMTVREISLAPPLAADEVRRIPRDPAPARRRGSPNRPRPDTALARPDGRGHRRHGAAPPRSPRRPARRRP